MENRVISLLVIALIMCYGLSAAVGFYRDEDWGKQREDPDQEQEEQEQEAMMGDEDWFLLQNSKQVVKTRAGEMRVVKSVGGRIVDKPMHIGFITMEPKSLFVPQYMDSSLILFVHSGEAKVGLIYRDELGERRLRAGDVYRIPAGSPFYLVNTGEGQRLHIICSVDTSESLGMGTLQSFYIGGGYNPASVLAGFDQEILESAFNVTSSELSDFLSRQQDGPIVYVTDSPHPPSLWSRFLELKEHDRLQNMKKMVGFTKEPDHQEEDQSLAWSWRKLLNSVFGSNDKRRDDPDTYKGKGKSHDAYNLFKRSADFKNDYGWSKALDESDYSPLKDSGVGVFLVNLSAGSMMAPHVNPIATEYGIVLRGSGTIQIVFPNGTSAMNTKVQEGDVFWVPRYFPFCQIASRTGPLEFFGFTTSARKNRPQFLVGASSVLRELRGPELAAAFGVNEDRLSRIVHAQRESVILPSVQAAPPYKGEEREPTPEEETGKQTPYKEDERRQEDTRRREDKREQSAEEDERRQPPYKEDERQQSQQEKQRRQPPYGEGDVMFQRLPKVIKSFGNEMVMGFD
ncbi:vicilin-like seed storage protein At2g28490 isoform X1 [Rosa rugosa]|uniref:vicilin-like seed storage protein At2g28490 isoform X1 n=1 Tax=Rosa rugosa TaxID=74645 RepID=UPI002B402FCD|nr:vicilin-like seed storage protein At2g28490 isoform X1 [Rosa rugosa]